MKNKYIPDSVKNYFHILTTAAKSFVASRPVDQASSTAYFAIFSIAPILIIIISIFGYLAGDSTIRIKLFNELNVLIGEKSTLIIKNAIDNYQISKNSEIGTIIGIGIFLFSATTLFSVIQRSINYIWRVKVTSNLKLSIFKLIRDRILSFVVILSFGFILLVSLLVDVVIANMKEFLVTYFSENFLFLAQILNFGISFAIISIIFLLIYRFLPDVKVRWSASWFGAIITSILFIIGKIVIGIIIGSSNLGAVYGTASSFIVIMVWIYYSSLIFYFGVVLTRQYSIYYKHENTPLNYAVPFEITILK